VNEFATQLKGLLTRNKMSQGALSRATGLSTTHISNIMNGRRLPRNATLSKIATALELSDRQHNNMARALGNTRHPGTKKRK
jgi:transcriptional regulator with XRE-family HTH domain